MSLNIQRNSHHISKELILYVLMEGIIKCTVLKHMIYPISGVLLKFKILRLSSIKYRPGIKRISVTIRELVVSCILTIEFMPKHY